MNLESLILKRLLQEADEDEKEGEPKEGDPKIPVTPDMGTGKTFEDNPMEFILKKYHSLNELMEELMTKSFKDFVDAIFVVAPKPTTFKIILHNGQSFILTYLGKAYEATVSGKNYYLSHIGEKERCMIAISRLLRSGSPIKSKGPEGAEQGTRDETGGGGGGSNSGMEGDWAEQVQAAGGSTGEEGGGEEGESGGEEASQETLSESILHRLILSEKTQSSVKQATVDAINKIINSPEGKKYKFKTQSEWIRLGNLDNISADQFVDVIKNTFNTQKVSVIPPKKGSNPSSKYSMFSFETDKGPVSIILSGGENKGQKYEQTIVEKIKSSAGTSLNNLQDPEMVTLFRAIEVDPKYLKPDDINFSGATDTKRSIEVTGPKNIGPKIADATIKSKRGNIYLSIKDKNGDTFYNGGNIPFIVEKNGKVVYDSKKHGLKPSMDEIFDIFNIDPKKVASGMNNYLSQSGKETGYVNVPVKNKQAAKNILSSGYGYGYFYVRETKNGLYVHNIDSAKDAEDMIGNIKFAAIKYPSVNTKTTTIKINSVSPIYGSISFLIELRNTAGKVLPISLKIKSAK